MDSPNNHSSITSKLLHRPGVAGSTNRLLSGENVKYINVLDYKDKEESRIRESKHLSTDADISTNTKKILLVRHNLQRFYTIYEQKFSNLKPFLSIAFPQGL